jgi:hypothetical protein
MPRPLVTQHYPDDFQVLSVPFRSFASGNLLFYFDRDTVIDSIVFSVQTAGGAGSSLQLAKTTGGTATTPASGAAANVTGGTALHTAVDISSGTATTVVSLTTPSSDTNLVKAGNFIGVIVAGTIGTPSGLISIRFRSRVA